MGTKSQAHLKNFYAQYRKRYRLDELIQNFKDSQNAIIELSDDDDEQVSNLIIFLIYKIKQ